MPMWASACGMGLNLSPRGLQKYTVTIWHCASARMWAMTALNLWRALLSKRNHRPMVALNTASEFGNVATARNYRKQHREADKWGK